MNLLDARLEPGDLGPEVVLGPHRLAVPPQVLAEHHLDRHLGQDVVVGIRPENLHDAALAHEPDPGSVIELPVELREELGSEVQAHCGTGAAPARLADGDAAAEAPRRAAIVARLDPRTAVREGQSARIHVDLGALHFFDPATGDSLRG
jgi:multiple sugar transport system ATP-binding protein